MAEVEAQPIRSDQGSGLLYVGAEHLAQRPVQHVGRGVVPADSIPAHGVDRGLHLVAEMDRSVPNHALVHDHGPGNSVSRVPHVEVGGMWWAL